MGLIDTILADSVQPTPALLFPYLEEKKGEWILSDTGRLLTEVELSELHRQSVLPLLCLEEPRLLALVQAAEKAYLTQTTHQITQQILDWVRPAIREWCMPLLAEAMTRRGHNIHPFITMLWANRSLWPYFSSDLRFHGSQTEAWMKLFKTGCEHQPTELEHYLLWAIGSLQYKAVNAYIFLTTIRAWAKSFGPDEIYLERYPEQTLPSLRRWLEACEHLLAYVERRIPLNHELLR